MSDSNHGTPSPLGVLPVLANPANQTPYQIRRSRRLSKKRKTRQLKMNNLQQSIVVSNNVTPPTPPRNSNSDEIAENDSSNSESSSRRKKRKTRGHDTRREDESSKSSVFIIRTRNQKKLSNKIPASEDPADPIQDSEDEYQEEQEEEALPTTSNPQSAKDIDWSKMISATKTRNYLMRDPILDWIQLHYTSFIRKYPGATKKVQTVLNRSRDVGNFTEFLFSQGHGFEEHVMAVIWKKFGEDVIIDIGGTMNPRSPAKVQETLDAMNYGYPFIYSGVLHDYENKTYGVPDLMVRSDWIGKLVQNDPVAKKDRRIPGTKLTDVHRPDRPPKFHYRIVDIKFSTLHLRVDGIHMQNSGSAKAFKGQLWVYNEALAKMQGYNPGVAYILGRKWEYKVKDDVHKGNSCFERLGVVDFNGVDSGYVEETQKALKWVMDVRQNGAKWDPFVTPACRDELYPNMCNANDYPWHSIKELIATRTKEITSLWMVGISHRAKAHKKGIYSWTDKRCTPQLLGTGPKTTPVLKKILDINRGENGAVFKKGEMPILPKVIQNNDSNWQTKPQLEFFVDFESMSNIADDFSAVPYVEATTLIAMIGVWYINPDTEKKVFRNFTVNRLSLEEECRICTEFSDFIKQEVDYFGCEDPLFHHWAHAERTLWDGAIDRHIVESVDWYLFNWFDMLKVFKSEPIVIKGCLKFGLKSVATALYKLGCIKTSWDSDGACGDGAGAMVGLYRAEKESKMRGISLQKHPLTRDIAKYNQIDCQVLEEIMTYLRENHCKLTVEEENSSENEDLDEEEDDQSDDGLQIYDDSEDEDYI